MGLVDFQDAESGEIITVDTSSSIFQKSYKRTASQTQEQRDLTLKRSRIDRIDVSSHGDFVQPLISFFKKRNCR